MSKRFLVVLFGALLGALLVAGCGSDNSESSASLTKAEFVKKADSICEASEKKGETEVEEFLEEEGVAKNEEPSKELQEQLAEEVVAPNISGQLEEIRALGFPEGTDGEEAEALIDSAEEDVEEIEEEPSALFSDSTFKQTNKEARAYGLTVCGSEG
ncbi:MAG TPA: hypothetical protein VG518_09220 [Solirubrobacterales bacterium]|nr:hypothetical protein [Solirubrobacterales bacterium]